MKSNHKIASRIAAMLPFETLVCGSFIYNPLTEGFAQGVLVEGTRSKNTYYVWNVVCPLFRPFSSISLNYGRRILNEALIIGTSEEVAQETLETLDTPSGLDRMLFARTISIGEFLAKRLSSSDWQKNFVLPEQFDYGIMFAYCGMIKEAEVCLKECLRRLEKERRGSDLWLLGTQILSSLRSSPDLIKEAIHSTIIRTAQSFELSVRLLDTKKS